MRGAPRLSVSPSASASCRNHFMTNSSGSMRAKARTKASERADEQEEAMLFHDVKVHASASALAREDQLAWKLAAVAAEPGPPGTPLQKMNVNPLHQKP